MFVLYYIVYSFVPRLTRWLWASVWRKPTSSSLFLGAVADLSRSKTELLIENALLRQQLIVLRRQVKRPHLNNIDRALLVLLAGRLRTWKSALLIDLPPGTLSLLVKRFWLGPVQDALTQEVELGPSIYLPLQHL